ncbi:MAG: hypothetical protein AAF125_27310, partial [Chloroflexota bacterium]
MLIAEPLWRLDALTAYGVSMGARINGGALMWLTMGLGAILIVGVQGGLAAVTTALGTGLYQWIYDLMWDFPHRSFQLQEQVAFLGAFLPFMLLPPVVWAGQYWLRRWRRRVAIRYIFRSNMYN